MARYAVIIGVSKYFDHSNFNDIPCCEKDARDIYTKVIAPWLTAFQPKDVFLLHDSVAQDELCYLPIEQQIDWALKELSSRAISGDTILFYFSGHGCIKDEEAFLVAKDTYWENLGTPGKGIRISEIRSVLQECKADRKIVIIDACHCGEGISKSFSGSVDDKFHDLLRDFGKGIAVLSSCQRKQRSYALNEQSIFTKYLLEGLEHKATDRQGNVTIYSLAEYVGREVSLWTESRVPPLKQNPTFYGELDARGFVLVPQRVQTLPTQVHKSAVLWCLGLSLRIMASRLFRWGLWYSFPMMRFASRETLRPIIPVRVSTLGNNTSLEVNAIVDSAAHICVIPKRLVTLLSIPVHEFVTVQGFERDGLREYPVYYFNIEVAGHRLPLKGIAVEREEVVLGISFMSHFTTVLDFQKQSVLLRRVSREEIA
jgi:uncharacterized caspase-like protein